LTRSLADFAKLVELFDAHGVSFVSVTQQFNTTTSMGRLTLNVLLSFAQFEREVTSERIRDKIGASKRKGLWVGGMVPLGYVSRDKKLFIEGEEAERVRTIFQRYLELGSIGLLLVDLRERGIVTKVRHLSDGRTVGGIPSPEAPSPTSCATGSTSARWPSRAKSARASICRSSIVTCSRPSS
jgi:DNA invertase Pin-like site-specific DNA recombinase